MEVTDPVSTCSLFLIIHFSLLRIETRIFFSQWSVKGLYRIRDFYNNGQPKTEEEIREFLKEQEHCGFEFRQISSFIVKYIIKHQVKRELTMFEHRILHII